MSKKSASTGFRSYPTLFKGVKLPWLHILFSLIVNVLAVTLQIRTFTLTANIIDQAKMAIQIDSLTDYIVTLSLAGLLTILTYFADGWMEQTIDLRVRTRVWDQIMHLPAQYYDADNGKELISRVTSDVTAVSSLFLLITSMITGIYGIISVFVQLFSYQAQLASWALLILPMTLIFSMVYSLLTHKAGLLTNVHQARSLGYIAERVVNFRLIKSAVTEEKEKKQASAHFGKLYIADLLSGISVSTFQIWLSLFNIVFIVVSFAAGSRYLQDGSITSGRLIGFYSLSGVITLRLVNMLSSIGGFASVRGIMTKVVQLMSAETEDFSGPALPDTGADLKLENVSFGYLPQVDILSDLSFTLPRGEVTAIIGTNGSGKSTVLKLLTRMYDPRQGRISLGQEDIRDYGLAAWRRKFSVVTQGNPLMSGTVRENMLYGLERSVTEEELLKVARLTGVADFVGEKAADYDVQVGPNGSNFSGGQQQLIAIARAMLRDSDFLLLDEATSNLDIKSEVQVNRALDELMKGRTTVIIAHNFAATRAAKNVIVLHEGRVEAAGTPAELLQSNDYYKHFVRSEAEESLPGCDLPAGQAVPRG